MLLRLTAGLQSRSGTSRSRLDTVTPMYRSPLGLVLGPVFPSPIKLTLIFDYVIGD